MIIKNYELENKDKEILSALYKYCKKFNNCHGCIFNKSQNGCDLQDIICKVSRAIGKDYNSIVEEIKE